MAHELSFTNGRADFFELNADGIVTAWHGEGLALPLDTPFEHALDAGRLLYPVAKFPVSWIKPDGTMVEAKTGGITVRTDTLLELGVVGADYSVVQNVDAFAIIRPLVESGGLRLETGGVLRHGADAWVLGQINLTMFPAEVRDALLKYGLAKYLLIRTNHSGRANASVTETDVRVVCANTLGMVEAGDYRTQASVQHRGDATARLKVAFDVVTAGMVRRTTEYLHAYDLLHARTLTESAWKLDVMDVVQRDPRERVDFDAKAPQADATVARYEAKRDRLHTLWYEGRGHDGDGSAWEAWNGVVEAVDHDGALFPVRASRVAQLMPGNRLHAIKQAVFASLTAHDGADGGDPRD